MENYIDKISVRVFNLSLGNDFFNRTSHEQADLIPTILKDTPCDSHSPLIFISMAEMKTNLQINRMSFFTPIQNPR